MKIYELTDRPELFKNTYWGNFTLEEFDETSENTREVCNNRNEVVKALGLKSVSNFRIYNKRDKAIAGWFDHAEVYNTVDRGRVLIVSPYSHVIGVPMALNVHPLPPLYSTHAISVAIFQNENEDFFKRIR